MTQKLLELHVLAQSSSPQQAAELLAADALRWGEVIQRAKISSQ